MPRVPSSKLFNQDNTLRSTECGEDVVLWIRDTIDSTKEDEEESSIISSGQAPLSILLIISRIPPISSFVSAWKRSCIISLRNFVESTLKPRPLIYFTIFMFLVPPERWKGL